MKNKSFIVCIVLSSFLNNGIAFAFGEGFLFMKKIYLGGKYGSVIGNYALVDDQDYEWLSKLNWTAHKPATGGALYAHRNSRNKNSFKMHRLILGLTDPKECCDHIDGNGLNNQRGNLRVCTIAQNNMNAKPQSGSSKYKGVDFVERLTKKWRAQIQFNGKKILIGLYNTETDAALAYNQAAIKYHKEFARLNTI